MAGYRDMMELVGKFKHVPTVLSNLRVPQSSRFQKGGLMQGYNPYKYDVGGSYPTPTPVKNTNTPLTTISLTEPISTNTGVNSSSVFVQGHTSGGFDPGYGAFNPYKSYFGSSSDTSTMGSTSTDEYGNPMAAKTGGGGYQGLTPYEGAGMNHSLISPKVSSFKHGGRMEKKSEVSIEEGLGDKETNSIEGINPNVSNESYQIFSSQLKTSENSSNKGYDKEKGLWFPFDVGVNEEKNIGWGINMSTFSDEDKKRMSKGVTSGEIEDIFNKRISKHLNKSKEKITEMGGDWDSLPDNAKLALADFSYNLGSLNKFPKFTQAIIDNDLETAKKEYKRYYTDKGVKKEMTSRNKDIYEMIFENAKGDGKIYKKGGTYVTPTQDMNQNLTPSESNIYGYELGGVENMYNGVKEKAKEIFKMINPYDK